MKSAIKKIAKLSVFKIILGFSSSAFAGQSGDNDYQFSRIYI